MQNLIHRDKNNLSPKNDFNLINYESFYEFDEKLISKILVNKDNLGMRSGWQSPPATNAILHSDFRTLTKKSLFKEYFMIKLYFF